MAGVWLWDGKAYRAASGRESGMDAGTPDDGDAVIVLASAGGGEDVLSRGTRGLLRLNDGAPAFAALEETERTKRMRMAGAAVSDPERPAMGRFAVSLFRLQPIAVERIARTRSGVYREAALSAAISKQDARYRPFVRLATRALYALGLDNGIVALETDDGGKCFVSGVSLPGREDYLRGRWREATIGLANELTNAPDRRSAPSASSDAPGILLGADPEFLLLGGDGRIVSAARYLAGDDGAGCDSVLVGGTIRYPIAELRPSPSPTPDGLARNIRVLLRRAARRIPDEPPLRWAAGGMPAAGFALGGHIHLSGVPLTGRLLRQLDSYVAFPLAMIESPAERARRPRYGVLGDFRLQPHGGFEYRTLPSWLVSPMAAQAAFALTLLCARETGSLDYVPATEDRFTAAYYAGERETLAGCADELAGALARTESYRELARWIDPLFRAIRAGRTWDAAGDFRRKWRVGRADGTD